MPRTTTTTRLGLPYTGSLRLDVPPTAGSPPLLTGIPQSTINDLLTPGLVPDIARQSAEVAAGRGIAGSPAADSTAVRMSEQNYLQRLGLANSLLSGEAARSLPYQITPFQSVQTALRQQELQNQRDIAQLHYQRYGQGGGQAPAGGGIGQRNTSAWAGIMSQPWEPASGGSVFGTRPEDSYGGQMPAGWPFQGGGQPNLDQMIQGLVGEEGYDPILGAYYDEGYGEL